MIGRKGKGLQRRKVIAYYNFRDKLIIPFARSELDYFLLKNFWIIVLLDSVEPPDPCSAWNIAGSFSIPAFFIFPLSYC